MPRVKDLGEEEKYIPRRRMSSGKSVSNAKKEIKRRKKRDKLTTKHRNTNYRSKLLRKQNQAEQHIEVLLMGMQADFVREKLVMAAGQRHRVDFMVYAVPGVECMPFVLEVDGRAHSIPSRMRRDAERADRLLTEVSLVLRMNWPQALSMSARNLTEFFTKWSKQKGHVYTYTPYEDEQTRAPGKAAGRQGRKG